VLRIGFEKCAKMVHTASVAQVLRRAIFVALRST
jgi:hypothetical protein